MQTLGHLFHQTLSCPMYRKLILVCVYMPLIFSFLEIYLQLFFKPLRLMKNILTPLIPLVTELMYLHFFSVGASLCFVTISSAPSQTTMVISHYIIMSIVIVKQQMIWWNLLMVSKDCKLEVFKTIF